MFLSARKYRPIVQIGFHSASLAIIFSSFLPFFLSRSSFFILLFCRFLLLKTRSFLTSNTTLRRPDRGSAKIKTHNGLFPFYKFVYSSTTISISFANYVTVDACEESCKKKEKKKKARSRKRVEQIERPDNRFFYNKEMEKRREMERRRINEKKGDIWRV